MNEGITEAEMRTLLDEYVAPVYDIAGAIMALIMFLVVFYVIIWPFIKRVGR